MYTRSRNSASSSPLVCERAIGTPSDQKPRMKLLQLPALANAAKPGAKGICGNSCWAGPSLSSDRIGGVMFDPAGIAAALASAKTILKLIQNANDAQLAMKISSEVANLQGRLIDIQQQAITLQSQNQELKDQIRLSESLDNIAKTLSFEGKVFWKSDEPDHPFSPLCWGLQQATRTSVKVGRTGGLWRYSQDRVQVPPSQDLVSRSD
jgi:hypothetical protein